LLTPQVYYVFVVVMHVNEKVTWMLYTVDLFYRVRIQAVNGIDTNWFDKTYFPSSFSISKVYVSKSRLRPSPHFNLRLFGAYVPHSNFDGLGGNGLVVTFTGELNAPTPIPFTACILTL
jgi:hypothetical protein